MSREINGLGVAFALHYLGIRKDTVMNIKALVASLVLGVVGTSSAALASPYQARREVVVHEGRGELFRRPIVERPIYNRPILVGRPGIGRPVVTRPIIERRPVAWRGPVFAGRREYRRW